MMADAKAGSLTRSGGTGRTMLADWVATPPSRCRPMQTPICLCDLLNPAAGQKARAVLDLGGNNPITITNKGDE